MLFSIVSVNLIVVLTNDAFYLVSGCRIEISKYKKSESETGIRDNELAFEIRCTSERQRQIAQPNDIKRFTNIYNYRNIFVYINSTQWLIRYFGLLGYY